MEDKVENLSGAEEYVAVEAELAEPLDPAQEKNLRDALEKLDAHALDSCDIGPTKISLCYDPSLTTKDALLGAIQQAGGSLKHVESEASPLL